jgi:transcriptional regulator with XRE-family HTH domain
MTPADLSTARQRRGQKLKDGRLRLGLNKKQFSEKTGLTRVTINKIENGTGSWSIDSELIYLNYLAENCK